MSEPDRSLIAVASEESPNEITGAERFVTYIESAYICEVIVHKLVRDDMVADEIYASLTSKSLISYVMIVDTIFAYKVPTERVEKNPWPTIAEFANNTSVCEEILLITFVFIEDVKRLLINALSAYISVNIGLILAVLFDTILQTLLVASATTVTNPYTVLIIYVEVPSSKRSGLVVIIVKVFVTERPYSSLIVIRRPGRCDVGGN